MSAHFDGGAEIAGRRLREVEVTYVDDPTLDMGAIEEEDDNCPASPPPTYYLRVREEKRTGRCSTKGPPAEADGAEHASVSKDVITTRTKSSSSGNNDENSNINGTVQGLEGFDRESRSKKGAKAKKSGTSKAWSWRYVNVEKKALLVWDRRGGRLLRSIPLKDVESLLVTPDPDAPASILEVLISSRGPDIWGTNASSDSSSSSSSSNSSSGSGTGRIKNITNGDNIASTAGSTNNSEVREVSATDAGHGGDVLVLQARSRRETLLWAKVLQENVELMTKRLVPLENRDEETSLSDVQQLAKLLTHQLSELQQSNNSKEAPKHRGPFASMKAANATIPEGVEGETES